MKVIPKTILTEDGFSLDTEIFEPNVRGAKVIVICHGLTGDKDGKHGQLLELDKKLCFKGFRVIRFDFRGHGKSSGIDLDVNVESLINDLDAVINSECKGSLEQDVYYFGFSFGAFAVMEYIRRMELKVPKLVLWSPALNPNDSSFENKNTFCYKEIYDAKNNGTLEKDGFVYWKSKNFKVSKLFIDQITKYNYANGLIVLPKTTMILQALNDKNIDKKYNENYAKEYGFIYREYEASHSLFETIDAVIEETVKYFNN